MSGTIPYWVIVLANGRYYCSPGESSTLDRAHRFYDPNVALACSTQLEGSTVKKFP